MRQARGRQAQDVTGRRDVRYTSPLFAGRSGGTGRRARLRGVWGNPWGFESPLRHSFSWGGPRAPPPPPPSGRPRGARALVLFLSAPPAPPRSGGPRGDGGAVLAWRPPSSPPP